MAAGTVQLYNIAYQNLLGDTETQWDAAGSTYYWYLVTSSYVPADTHTTTNDLGANIKAGDGAPIVSTNRVLDDTTTAGTMFFQAGANSSAGVVSFTTATTPGTITGVKYLVCTQPVSAGSPNSTSDRLIFYVNLNTATASATVTATNGEFTVNMPTNGWFKMNQA